MKSHFANSLLGALDYLAYPLGMLILAPAILHSLGTQRYGIWAFSCAMLNTGAVLASGFADANTRAVATALSEENRDEVRSVVQSSFGIHIALGVLFTSIG